MKKPNFDTPVEYVTKNEIPYLVLPMDFKKRETLNCPFCGYKHHHGNETEGHRIAHCKPDLVKNKIVVHTDGTKLFQSNGYYLRFINESRTMEEQDIIKLLKNPLSLSELMDNTSYLNTMKELAEMKILNEKNRANAIKLLNSFIKRDEAVKEVMMKRLLKR